MNFHVLTLFPEMIEQGLHTSILGKAMEKGCITLETTNIRDFSANKYNRVDDYPYGGGAGMLMQAEPCLQVCGRKDWKIRKNGLSDAPGQGVESDDGGRTCHGRRSDPTVRPLRGN